MIALALIVVAGAGAFVAIVLAQAALNRRITGSERRGGWAGPIARALLPGTAYEVGAPWKAIALVAALLVAVFVVIPRVTGGPSLTPIGANSTVGSGSAASSGEDCRQVMVLTPDHPAGVLVERCGPSPVAEVVYPDDEPARPGVSPMGDSTPARAAASPIGDTPASTNVEAPAAMSSTPAPAAPTVRLAPGEIVAASDGGVLIGDPRSSWAQTDGSGVVIACAGQGCEVYPTGYRVTR